MVGMDASAVEIGRIALRALLAVGFVVMGISHFRAEPARMMAALIPPGLRFTGALSPANLVRFTGLCEIAGGLGLLLPATTFAAAIGLMFFLIAVFPANAYAAEHPERFGRIAVPFWPRYLLQLALIAALLLATVPLPR